MTNTAMRSSFNSNLDLGGFVTSMQDAGARASALASGNVQEMELGMDNTHDNTFG